MPFHDIQPQGPQKKDWTDYLTPLLGVAGGAIGAGVGGPAGAQIGFGIGQAVGGFANPNKAGMSDVNSGLSNLVQGYAKTVKPQVVPKGDAEMVQPTAPPQSPQFAQPPPQLPPQAQPTIQSVPRPWQESGFKPQYDQTLWDQMLDPMRRNGGMR